MGVQVPYPAGRAAAPDAAELLGSIEQYIGMTQIPTGLIGPIRVNSVHAHGDYHVPLATTEGKAASEAVSRSIAAANPGS